jgi:hypothetical protein
VPEEDLKEFLVRCTCGIVIMKRRFRFHHCMKVISQLAIVDLTLDEKEYISYWVRIKLPSKPA